jgi:hypothetical protein
MEQGMMDSDRIDLSLPVYTLRSRARVNDIQNNHNAYNMSFGDQKGVGSVLSGVDISQSREIR